MLYLLIYVIKKYICIKDKINKVINERINGKI